MRYLVGTAFLAMGIWAVTYDFRTHLERTAEGRPSR